MSPKRTASWSARDALTLVQSAPDAMYACDRTGRLLAANPAFIRALGRELSDVLDSDFFSWVHPEFRDATRRAIEALVDQGQGPVYSEVPLVDGSGHVLWLGQQTQVVVTAGKVAGWQAVARDITLARTAEGKRQYADAHAQQARHLEALGQLAGGVAHNFNNLLTAVVGFSEDLLAESGRSESDRRALAQIQRAGRRAALLTRQLLAFSRGHLAQSGTSDVGQVLAAVQRRMSVLLRDDIVIQSEFAASPLVVQADPGILEHIVVTLMLNAQDALPSGGEITLDASGIEGHSQIRSSWSAAGEAQAMVRIRVADNGIGMDEETRRHVFEPFFTTKRVGAGTGLGLAAVYGLVRSLGGAITVASQLGHGTTCDVYLPAVAASDTGPRVQSAAPKILVVDGDIAILNLSARLLRNAGFDVRTATSGDEALDVLEAEAEEMSVLLVDLDVSGQTGGRLLVDATARWPRLRCAAMSVYGSLASKRVPGLPVIGKPFASDELTQLVSRLVARTSAQSS